MRTLVGMSLLAVLAAAPAPLVAQQPQGAAPAHGEVGHRGAGHGPAVGMLLRHRAELQLTDQQITRLEQIAQRLQQQNEPLLQQLRAAGIPVRPERRDGVREMTPEQRRELRERLEAHRPTLMQMRQNTRTAMEDARGVLTTEQQTRMRELTRARAAEMRERRQAAGPRTGAMAPGERRRSPDKR